MKRMFDQCSSSESELNNESEDYMEYVEEECKDIDRNWFKVKKLIVSQWLEGRYDTNGIDDSVSVAIVFLDSVHNEAEYRKVIIGAVSLFDCEHI
eukprot:gene14864-16542_t